jgi:hypothetical protein
MRGTHLVGSLPATDAGAAMEQALASVGDGLHCLADGETGERFHWVIHIVEGLRSHPDLEVKKEGDWSDYDRIPVLRVRDGHRLDGASLDFGHVRSFTESFPLFLEARERAGRPDLAFQVGIPGDFDMGLFVLGPLGAVRHRAAFADATVAEIATIFAQGGRDVVFQLEIPVELVAVARMPRALQGAVASLLARGVAKLARRSPVGARFGVHLCLGDMNHKALGQMQDTGPLVALANALSRAWPSDRPLEYVHAPFAGAEVPPPLSARWYAPLDGLKLGPSTVFAAGFAHEDQPLEDQRFLRDLIERTAGREVAISHSCGLGRRSPESAERALARLAELR